MVQRSSIRITAIIILSAIIFTVIAISFSFTSQTGWQSNMESYKISEYIEGIVAKHFEINHEDTFWKETLNLLVRKAAHFLEYMLLGFSVCALLIVIFQKRLLAALITVVVCQVLSLIDEYRQNFILGRNARLFDVQVDMSGAGLGIILVSIIFTVVWKNNRLKVEK